MQKSDYSIIFTLPLVWYISYTLYKHIQDPFYMSMIDRVDFFIHEFGHLFFWIFGNQFLAVLWGSLMQLLIPIALLSAFILQRDKFAVAFCLTWIGTNFFYISMYAGDAIRLDLPLIWIWGWEVIHDWNYLFHETQFIIHTNLIADIFYITAIVFYIVWLFYALLLMINRIRAREF